MSIELQYDSIIIPIENINRCKSLGGFEKFIELQKDRIGHDVWYDEYLYRYRIPDYDSEEMDLIYEFWKQQGLQPFIVDGESQSKKWKDICFANENGPSLACDWLEIDKDVPCVWFKGKPRGELCGSIRRNSKIISETTIDPQYYINIFKRLYKLHEDLRQKFHNYTKKRDRYSELDPPKFDINIFLDIFDLIKLNKGYTLDYEYLGNCPVVFTRLINPIPDEVSLNDNDIKNALGPFCFENIKDISFEQSPEGFFQFAVFSVAVHQFYLYWHALYNDTVFIYSKSQLEDNLRIILKDKFERALYAKWELGEDISISRNEISEKVERDLSDIFKNKKNTDDVSFYIQLFSKTRESIFDRYKTNKTREQRLIELFNLPHPKVTILENGYGTVKMLTFSKWGGFLDHYSYIKWPHTIERKNTEKVFDYDCGIEF